MRWIRRQVGWIAAAAVCGFLVWMIATASTLQVTQANAVGTLFGQPVSADTFQKARSAVTHHSILRYGDKSHQTLTEELISEQAWERLMLLEEAKRRKIRVSDREVVEELRSVPLFQTSDGRFDHQGYRGVVQYTLGTTPRNFEEEMRENLTIQKLLQQVVEIPPVTEEEIAEVFRKQQTSLRITSLVLQNPGLAEEVLHASRQTPQQMEAIGSQLRQPLLTTPFFKIGEQVPELDLPGSAFAALFDKEPGEVAGPFRSSKGWLVTRLKEKRTDPTAEPSEEDRERLRTEAASRKRLAAYLAWYQDLLGRANRKPRTRD